MVIFLLIKVSRHVVHDAFWYMLKKYQLRYLPQTFFINQSCRTVIPSAIRSGSAVHRFMFYTCKQRAWSSWNLDNLTPRLILKTMQLKQQSHNSDQFHKL